MTERKHLTEREIDKLLAATKGGRNEARDRCLLLLMFRHGLRVSEASRDAIITGGHRKPRLACGAS